MDVTTINVTLEKTFGCIIVLCHIVEGSRTAKRNIAILEGMRLESPERLDLEVDVWYFIRGESLAITRLQSWDATSTYSASGTVSLTTGK